MIENANLYSLFAERFQRSSEKPALVDATGHGFSYGRLATLSGRFAGVLHDHGVRAGDRVVAQVEKTVGAVALYLACLRLGAIYAPLNTAYTAAEVAYFLEDAAPRVFVSGRDDAPAGDWVHLLLGDETSALWRSAQARDPHEAVAWSAPDDIAALVYTSGTTGRSKGAMLSHGNLASNALTLHRLWGFQPDDVLIHALPIFHVHGLFVALNTLFLNGTSCFFLPRFDAEQILALMPRATLLMGVPTYYTRLLASDRLDRVAAQGMRLFISGSAPLLPETHQDFARRTGYVILERYGMSEAGMITSNPLVGERVAGTVGYPLPDVDLRIVGEGGEPVTQGQPGVIEIRGPNVFKGYWRMPEKTAADFHEGWFITGDIGVAAPDGRISIVGRAKDLIISGGYNIYPREIEAVVDALDGVEESAVIGVAHPDLGEAAVCLVVARRNDVDVDSIAARIAPLLARYKMPRHFALLDQLPRNAMGKVQKAELRRRYQSLFTAG